MNAEVESLIQGLESWKEELQQLRNYLLDCNLQEELKWKQPCYTFNGKNVILIGRFKSYITLSFFRGVLLEDKNRLLESPGENSQSVKYLKFNNLKDVIEGEALIKTYVHEAIELEAKGITVEKTKSTDIDLPVELVDCFEADEIFKRAFINLTKGRQRGYIIYITAAKNSSTRKNRILKYKDRITKGFGLNDCVCGHSKRMPNCDGSHKNHPKMYE